MVHILDWLFYEKDIRVLFQIGLAILFYLKDSLLSQNTTSDIISILKEQTNTIPGFKLMEIATSILDQIQSDHVLTFFIYFILFIYFSFSYFFVIF